MLVMFSLNAMLLLQDLWWEFGESVLYLSICSNCV